MITNTLHIQYAYSNPGVTKIDLLRVLNLMFIGPCIIVIVETKDQLDVICYFYFTSYALNMFRTLIYPPSGAYDYSVELPHRSCVLGSMCVGVSVWNGMA